MPITLPRLARLLPVALLCAIGLHHASAQTARLEAYLQEPNVIASRTYGGVVRSPAGTPVDDDYSIPGRPLGLITEHPLGAQITLTAPGGVYNGAPTVFLGWAPTDYSLLTGFAPASTQNPLTITLDADRRLVGYTGTPIATALDTPGRVWLTGGHALWTGTPDVFSPGSGLTARARTLRADGEETYLETVVTGPALVGFNWRLDSATGNVATLELLVNGSVSATYSPLGASWKRHYLDVADGESATLRFRLRRITTGTVLSNPISQESAYLGDFAVGERTAPSGLLATPNAVSGMGFARILWTAGFGAEKHLVELSTDEDFTAIAQSHEATAPAVEHTFYNLDTATRYYYRVTALADGHAPLATPAPHPSFVPAAPRTPQGINFDALAYRLASAPAFTLAATASSGLGVVFEIVSGPATLGEDGHTVTLTGTAGTVTIRATQPGDATYAAAEPQVRSFEVAAAPATPPTKTQKIAFTAPAKAAYGDAPLVLSATASSGLPVAFEVSGPAALAGDGKTLVFTGAGKVVVKATQPGGGDYKPAAAVSRTITVAKAVLAVNFADVSRLVGKANPAAFAIDGYAGFVGEETAAISPGFVAPLGVTKATATSPAGVYPITPKGGSSANYTFAPGDGFVTVEGFGGSYEALLVDDDELPLGKLEITVSANSLAFTGTLHLASEPAAITLRSNLDATDGASAHGAFRRTTDGLAALDLGFEIVGDTLDGDLARNGEAYLSIGSGTRLFVQALDAGKKKLPSAWTGAHTLVLRAPTPVAADDAAPLPQGAGSASAAIAPTGVMTLQGTLADGVKLTATAKPDQAGLYRVFVRPYGKRLESVLSGPLALVEHPDQARFAGRFHVPVDHSFLYWSKAALPDTTKPAKQDKSCREGFETDVTAILDPWLPPAAKAVTVNGVTIAPGNLVQRLGLASVGTENAELSVSYGPGDIGLGQSADKLPARLLLNTKGAVSVVAPVTTPANATKFTLKITPATGAFTGSFTLADQVDASTPKKPDAMKTVTRKVTFTGTLRQPPEGDEILGAGAFLLPDLADKNAEQPSLEILLAPAVR